MSVVIAERVLNCSEDPGSAVLISIVKPEFHPETQDYQCAYYLKGANVNVSRYAAGIDSYQALELAFVMIAVEISYIERTSGVRLTTVTGAEETGRKTGPKGTDKIDGFTFLPK